MLDSLILQSGFGAMKSILFSGFHLDGSDVGGVE